MTQLELTADEVQEVIAEVDLVFRSIKGRPWPLVTLMLGPREDDVLHCRVAL